MMPVAAYNLLQSIDLLASSSNNFALQCIDGLKSTNKGPESVQNGLAICTALAPKIGYDNAAKIAKKAKLDALVCSAQEVKSVKKIFKKAFSGVLFTNIEPPPEDSIEELQKVIEQHKNRKNNASRGR